MDAEHVKKTLWIAALALLVITSKVALIWAKLEVTRLLVGL